MAKTSPSKRGIARRREIDPETIGTNLFASDKRFIDDEIGKKGTTRSEFLRLLVHDYVIKKRLAPDAADHAQEASLGAQQKKTAAAVGEVHKLLQGIQKQLREMGQTQADSLTLNETEFKRVVALGSAQYNLSAQSFSAVWAALYFLQH